MISITINETFFSPQGEGRYTGVPTFFVRFFGCNLDCSWCDQPNALRTRPGQSFRETSDEELAEEVCRHHISVPVCFTGGEPTAQHQGLVSCVEKIREIDAATYENYPQRRITIETNGTIHIPTLAPGCFLSISPKFTGVFIDAALTAHGQKAIFEWMTDRSQDCQLKFVVETAKHFEGIVKWLAKTPRLLRRDIPIYFQPEWFTRDKHALREAFRPYVNDPDAWMEIAGMGFESIRFTTQSHKYLAMR